MSYDVSLVKGGQAVTVAPHEDGGTYVLGGSPAGSLNVTYNYAKHFEVLDEIEGLRWLYGKTGAETEARLAFAVGVLGTQRYADYWKATPGNAGYALSILLKWAKEHPDAVWEGD